MSTSGTLKQLAKSGAIAAEAPSIPKTGMLDVPSITRFAGMAELLIPLPSLEELDVPQTIITDILLRLTYSEGDVSATHAEEVIKIPYRLLDDLLAWLQQEHLVEVSKAVGSLGRRLRTQGGLAVDIALVP